MELAESLVENYRHCIVKDRLAKDDRVQLWVDLVCVKYGKDSDWISGREGGAKDEALHEADLEARDVQEGEDVDDEAVNWMSLARRRHSELRTR